MTQTVVANVEAGGKPGLPGEPADMRVETSIDEKALGDAGKRALDAMKSERNTARQEAAAAKAEADLLKAQIAGKESEHRAAQEAQRLRDEARIEADKRANERILKADIRAAAAGKLSDPSDALRYFDLSSFEVKEDGSTDEAAIAKAVENLVKERPYLAAASAPKWQDIDAHRNGAAPGKQPQLSAEDVKRLFASKKFSEIEAARQEGRLDGILGIKSV